MFLGWFLECFWAPLDLQKWAFRLDETLFFTFPTFQNTTSKLVHEKVGKKWDFGRILGSILVTFASQNVSWNQVKKKDGQKRKKENLTDFWGRPGGMCGARGETREGSRKAKVEESWEKILERNFDSHNLTTLSFESSTLVPYLKVRAAERWARSAGPILYGQWSA